MPNDAALPSVQDHAKALQEQLVAEGKMQPDATSSTTAAPPPFSQGTATLEPGTGQVQAPANPTPEFTQGAVAVPEGTETTGTTVAPAIASPAAPADAATPPAQAAATAAADAAAAQAAEDLEQWEFEDPDLQVKIPLKFPKQYSQTIKRAFPRRADYDRIKQRWGEFGPVLEPLLQDGRFRQIAPLLQRALQDPAYGEYVFNGYQRAVQGLPLVEQAIQQAAQMGQATQTVPTGQDPPLDDPFFDAAIKPLRDELNQVKQGYQTLQQQREEEARRARDMQQQQEALAQQLKAAHVDLERQFPGEFNATLGPSDPGWSNALKFAKDYGYIDTYGVRAGVIFGAQQWKQMEAERLAATASPAAQALQSVDARTVELARQQAAAAAQVVGGGAPTATAPPPPAPKPSPKNADGSMKPADQYLRETQAWLESQRR